MIAHKWTNHILVAKDGDKVIGFVGYKLMNAAFEKQSNYNNIAVWVLKGNERAIKFYEKYGFHFDGTEMEVKPSTSNTELKMIFERK